MLHYFGKLLYQFAVLFTCFVPISVFSFNIYFLETETLYNVTVNIIKF